MLRNNIGNVKRGPKSFGKHEEKPFSFQELIKESIKGMKMNHNQSGLQEVAKAIPSAKQLIDALAEHKVTNPGFHL